MHVYHVACNMCEMQTKQNMAASALSDLTGDVSGTADAWDRMEELMKRVDKLKKKMTRKTKHSKYPVVSIIEGHSGNVVVVFFDEEEIPHEYVVYFNPEDRAEHDMDPEKPDQLCIDELAKFRKFAYSSDIKMEVDARTGESKKCFAIRIMDKARREKSAILSAIKIEFDYVFDMEVVTYTETDDSDPSEPRNQILMHLTPVGKEKSSSNTLSLFLDAIYVDIVEKPMDSVRGLYIKGLDMDGNPHDVFVSNLAFDF